MRYLHYIQLRKPGAMVLMLLLPAMVLLQSSHMPELVACEEETCIVLQTVQPDAQAGKNTGRMNCYDADGTRNFNHRHQVRLALFSRNTGIKDIDINKFPRWTRGTCT